MEARNIDWDHALTVAGWVGLAILAVFDIRRMMKRPKPQIVKAHVANPEPQPAPRVPNVWRGGQ